MSLISGSYSGFGPDAGALECGDMVEEKVRRPEDRMDDRMLPAATREDWRVERCVRCWAKVVEEVDELQSGALFRPKLREAVRSALRAAMDDIVPGFFLCSYSLTSKDSRGGKNMQPGKRDLGGRY